MGLTQLMKKCTTIGLAATLMLSCTPLIPANTSDTAFADEITAPPSSTETTSNQNGEDVPGNVPVTEPNPEPTPDPEPDPVPDPDPTPDPEPDPTPQPEPTPKPTIPPLSAGWNYQQNAWYWGNSDGTPRTGWLEKNGVWYWLDPENNGQMATGWTRADGRWYYLDGSGAMQTGWLQRGRTWYYLNASGAMAEGWKQLRGTWYYLTPESGAMATGWTRADGRWYYLDGSGAMQTGWLQRGRTWYYLNASGAMAEGWKQLRGTWYYLTPESGAMATGWLDLNGTWYWLDGSGAMATGTRTIDGRTSLFNKNGAWLGYDKVEELFTKWAQAESSSTNWLVLVDTSRCKVGIFHGSKGNWALQRMMDCAPGKSSTPTKKGRFTVGSKGYYFDSGSARCFYFTQFSGNYLFHSVLYAQTSSPQRVTDATMGRPASHGCVRLQLSNAKWIYDNIPRGSKVYVW